MKRQLKFRAWEGEKMIYSDKGQFYLMSSNIQIPSSTGHEFYDRDYPVMQLTGLTDKNGVEIYEGDILQGDNSVIYSVFFDNGSFMGRTEKFFLEDESKRAKEQYPQPNHLRDFQMSSIKVIGNVYQNPTIINN